MGLLTPEEALTRFRAGGQTAEERDWLANEFYRANKASEGGYLAGLTPQEKMQQTWLQFYKKDISGNKKDKLINNIRKEAGIANEFYGTKGDPSTPGKKRYITRNKIFKESKKDGITAGDVWDIGGFTMADTGKDDGLFQKVINKSLPGFDVGDVTSLPGIDWLALAASPYTGGVSTAVLEGLKAAEAGKIGPETVASIVGAAGGWGEVFKGLKDFLPATGEMPSYITDAINWGKETYDTVANNPYIQDAQDLYGQIRDFTDPLEDIFGTVGDIFGDMDLGGLEQFLPGMPAAQGYARAPQAPLEKVDLLPLEYTNTNRGIPRFIDPFAGDNA